MPASQRPEMLNLELSSASRLGEAQRRIGGLETLSRIWPFWPGFASGPLTALFGVLEAGMAGQEVDLAQVLALGAEPSPSRPNLGMRHAVGVMLALGRLDPLKIDIPLTPALVTEIFQNIDAPHLNRGMNLGLEPAAMAGGVLPGAAYWTMARRWIEAGLPMLWSAGLALAFWEREGPEHANRSLTGRVLLAGLAMRLGLPSQAFCFLGPYLELAASKQPNGLDGLLADLRSDGSWRLFMEVFLAAAMMSAAQVVEIVLQAQQLYLDHDELIAAWVRAPANPQRLLKVLVEHPVVDLPLVSQRMEVTQRTAGLLVKKLAEIGLLVEITGQKRGRRYAYKPLLGLLQPGWGEEESQNPD